MKYYQLVVSLVLLWLLCACGEATPFCPAVTGTPQFLAELPSQLATPTPGVGLREVQIGKDKILVDKVVEGALCNDTWRGIVYVTCNVEVYPWTEEPTFLEDCQLDIDPRSVVYVANHNNTAYYNGCSCHTGITPEP